MNKPRPKELDGAKVLYVSVPELSQSYGLIYYSDTGREEPIAALAISQYDDDVGAYVFACNQDWEVKGDLYYYSVEEAMADAERYYEVTPIKWEEVIAA